MASAIGHCDADFSTYRTGSAAAPASLSALPRPDAGRDGVLP
jgi:hypothetical protein